MHTVRNEDEIERLVYTRPWLADGNSKAPLCKYLCIEQCHLFVAAELVPMPVSKPRELGKGIRNGFEAGG